MSHASHSPFPPSASTSASASASASASTSGSSALETDAGGLPNRRAHGWTSQEDECLREAVGQLSAELAGGESTATGPTTATTTATTTTTATDATGSGGLCWKQVSERVRVLSRGRMQRTPKQCSQRWLRVLDPRISRREWTAHEDERLRWAVLTYGVSAWTRIARAIDGRTDIQCRSRWLRLQQHESLAIMRSLSLSLPLPLPHPHMGHNTSHNTSHTLSHNTSHASPHDPAILAALGITALAHAHSHSHSHYQHQPQPQPQMARTRPASSATDPAPRRSRTDPDPSDVHNPKSNRPLHPCHNPQPNAAVDSDADSDADADTNTDEALRTTHLQTLPQPQSQPQSQPQLQPRTPVSNAARISIASLLN